MEGYGTGSGCERIRKSEEFEKDRLFKGGRGKFFLNCDIEEGRGNDSVLRRAPGRSTF